MNHSFLKVFKKYFHFLNGTFTLSLCVSVCVCVFVSFHHKRFCWLNTNVIAEFRSAMVWCRNISVWRTFVSVSKAIIEKRFELVTLPKSVSWTRKFSKNSTIKAKSISTFLLTNLMVVTIAVKPSSLMHFVETS